MDRFMTYEGEQPIFLDDFNFMQDTVKDTFCRIVQTMMRSDKPTCIMSGCDLTFESGQVSWSDGIIMLDGEILPVKAGVIEENITNDSKLYFSILTSYDPKGERSFKNGEIHNCYQIRHATLGTVKNDYNIKEIPRLEDVLNEKSVTIYSDEQPAVIDSTISIVQPLGGGSYVKGRFRVTPALGASTATVMAQHLINVNIPVGETLGVMTYMTMSGNFSVHPILIRVTRSNMNVISMIITLMKETSFAMGTGQFYCRLTEGDLW